jgi:GNAT superfamily N-acetyltransferase
MDNTRSSEDHNQGSIPCDRAMDLCIRVKKRKMPSIMFESNSISRMVPVYTFYLYKKHDLKNHVGYIDLVETRYGFHETHSFIDESYRGTGVGIKLYKHAIDYALKRGINVRSSTKPSEDASRVWHSKRLRSSVMIKKIKKRYRVIGPRSLEERRLSSKQVYAGSNPAGGTVHNDA